MTFEEGLIVAWCMAAGGVICWWGFQVGRLLKKMKERRANE